MCKVYVVLRSQQKQLLEIKNVITTINKTDK